MQSLVGTGVALVTPFKKDLSVDVEALQKIVHFQIDNQIEYLVVLGTTAENVTLSDAEKNLVIQTVVDANKKRLPLVLGVGGNDTSKVIEELKSRDLSAFDAVLSVSPYYNKPTQEGIYQHFKAIAQASPLPIILYNVPGTNELEDIKDVIPEYVTSVYKFTYSTFFVGPYVKTLTEAVPESVTESILRVGTNTIFVSPLKDNPVPPIIAE